MSARTTLVGRIGREPDLRFAPNGTAVFAFSVVTSGRRKDQNSGQWEDVDTTWWDCVAFGETAEKYAEVFEKGDPVIVVGTAFNRPWEDKEGNKRQTLSFRVDNLGLDIRWSKKQFRNAAPAESSSPSGLPNEWDQDEPPF
jgi:single-strand DNA-binding protein